MKSFDEIPHTAGCLAHLARVREAEARLAQWWRVWTHACRACDGSGVVMVDSGDPSVGLPPYYDFCDACIYAGACPRCGQPHGCSMPAEDVADVDFPFVCVACGFTNEASQVSAQTIRNEIVGVPDCICEEERYARWEAEQRSAAMSPDMSMTEEEIAEYHRTWQVPQSYIQRADRLYKEWQERFRH